MAGRFIVKARVSLLFLIGCAAFGAAGCGSGSSGEQPPPPPPPPANLAFLVVSPQNPVIADNGAVQALTATGHLDDGSTEDLTTSATWTSSNTAVATVDGAGHVTPKALGAGQIAGFSTIKAVSGGFTGATVLSVTNHSTNAGGFAGVFTQHNDIGRTGQNLGETILTPAAVAVPAAFGKKFSQAVDGFIYAQPLYVPNVAIRGKGTHNVVYVVTENDSVYAFDADCEQRRQRESLWKVTLLDAAHGAGTGASPTNTQHRQSVR